MPKLYAKAVNQGVCASVFTKLIISKTYYINRGICFL